MTRKRFHIIEDEPITALDEAQIMRDLGYEVTGIAMSGGFVRKKGATVPEQVFDI